MTAIRLSYTVRFLCPAFLGNAEQSGQWRTPPLKALLRQWWRVAYAADHKFSVDANQMSVAEGWLFGAAAEASASNKSRVRIRLDGWDSGNLKLWQPTARVKHREVGPAGRDIASDLYLGYGPLTFKEGGTALKANAVAIQAGERHPLRIALTSDVSQAESRRFAKAIALANLYGALGGRSRNGWGSFVLEAMDGTPAPVSLDGVAQRPWREALVLDWPHAIGKDEVGPLIWQTQPFSDWKEAIKRFAEIKIGLRTQFTFPADGSPPYQRHWLSYPVTNHPIREWDGKSLRLPNSLRFKLRPDTPSSTKLRGVIFHVPCLPPTEFRPNRQDIQPVWRQVHAFLDKPEQKLSRIAT